MLAEVEEREMVWDSLDGIVSRSGPRAVARWLVVPLQKAEYYKVSPTGAGHYAIVVLGAGNAPQPGVSVFPSAFGHSRIEAAAMAFRRIVAGRGTCTVIASGGDPDALGKTEAAVYAERWVKLGFRKTGSNSRAGA